MGGILAPTPAGVLRFPICRSCQSAFSRQRRDLRNCDRINPQRRAKGHIARPGEQAVPLKGYYADILSNPHLSYSDAHATSRPKPPPSKPSPPSDPSQEQDEPSSVRDKREEVQAKARIVFGSRLAGPIERQARRDASRSIAGILVPPKPAEPENCCMSGCVNCVWDQFRDDLEDWARKSTEAKIRLEAQRKGEEGAKQKMGKLAAGMVAETHGAKSMDEDGGASDTNWSKDMSGLGEEAEGVWAGIPVGIREFMKTEKMLKERHQAGKEAST